MLLQENLAHIKENIKAAVMRTPQLGKERTTGIKIVAVTKNQDAARVQEAIAAGIDTLGENRLQEAAAKAPLIESAAEWQLIGHLQTNKVRPAVQLFSMIQSVDSQRLLLEINRIAGTMNKCQDILIQVNVAQEDSKFGIAAEEVQAFSEFVSTLANVRLCGLMTIAPFYEDTEMVRPIFRKMYQLFTELKAANLPGSKVEWLSMGMTNDYVVAVEEGANLVRIGTGLFGERQY